MPKSLADTNPYLRDPQVRNAALRRSAATSSAVEGIRRPFQRPAENPDAVMPAERPKTSGSCE